MTCVPIFETLTLLSQPLLEAPQILLYVLSILKISVIPRSRNEVKLLSNLIWGAPAESAGSMFSVANAANEEFLKLLDQDTSNDGSDIKKLRRLLLEHRQLTSPALHVKEEL